MTPGPAGPTPEPPRTSVRVTIVGEEYTIRSPAPESHTRAVAEYVDRVIQQVLGTGAVVETHKAAILAALQIADELIRLRDEDAALGARLAGLTGEVRRLLPPVKRGDAAAGE